MTAVKIEESSVVEHVPMTAEEAKRMMLPGIRWSAIFAGVVVGISVQTLLGILGIAGGLSTISSVATGENASYGPMLWTLVSLLISAFAGGFFASRLSGSRRKGDGAMFGAVTWAVSMLVLALMLSTAAGSILNGMMSAANTTIIYSTPANSVSPAVMAQLRQELGDELNNSHFQQLQLYLQGGQREEAIVYLTSLGINSSDAVSVVNNAMEQIGNTAVVTAQPLISPEQLIRAVSAAAWMVFIGVTLSLIVSVCGGIIGAKYVYRSIWGKNGFPRILKEKNIFD